MMCPFSSQSLEHLRPPTPTPSSPGWMGEVLCLTTHTRAPDRQRYPSGPQELDPAHLLVVHPQHVIEIVLLCIIFNQKIHLENPRAEL